VHDARRALTRLRGLARLVRPGIGEDAYHELNRRLRDAVWALSGTRDEDVAEATLVELGEASGVDVSAALGALRGRTGGDGSVVSPGVEPIARRFEEAPFRERERVILRVSLGRALGQFRRRGDRAALEPSDERMHAWRKSARHLRAQLRLLRGANRRVLRDLERRVDALCDTLGSLHDLAVLRGRLTDAGVFPGEIARAVEAREASLRGEAFEQWRRVRKRAHPRVGARIARWRHATRKR